MEFKYFSLEDLSNLTKKFKHELLQSIQFENFEEFEEFEENFNSFKKESKDHLILIELERKPYIMKVEEIEYLHNNKNYKKLINTFRERSFNNYGNRV